MSAEHPDIDAEVPLRRAARLQVAHLTASYDTITPAMAASAVLKDATSKRDDGTLTDAAWVATVLGVADALAADEPARPVAWVVLDAQDAVRSVERSRIVALDEVERRGEGWHVAPLVVASLGEVADEGAGA